MSWSAAFQAALLTNDRFLIASINHKHSVRRGRLTVESCETSNIKPLKITESSIISIAKRLKHFSASRVIEGIGDDCAVIRTPGKGAMLITTDVFIEGIHFLPGQPADSVGGKLLAVNLSDIAAMGGRPCEAVVAVMLPDSIDLTWVEGFYAGLESVAERFGVNVVGGDVSRHPDRITLALTLTGRSRRDEILYRSGGKPGDQIYVSGYLGEADAGLELMKQSSDPLDPPLSSLNLKYLNPTPRIELGRLLARTHTASSCIDLSDGLSVGARQLASAGGLSMDLQGSLLPVSGDLKTFCRIRNLDPQSWVLGAGGDYELLFTVPYKSIRRVERFRLTHPDLPPLWRIGQLIDGDPGRVTVEMDGHRQEVKDGGWEHFGEL